MHLHNVRRDVVSDRIAPAVESGPRALGRIIHNTRIFDEEKLALTNMLGSQRASYEGLNALHDRCALASFDALTAVDTLAMMCQVL